MTTKKRTIKTNNTTQPVKRGRPVLKKDEALLVVKPPESQYVTKEMFDVQIKLDAQQNAQLFNKVYALEDKISDLMLAVVIVGVISVLSLGLVLFK